jgi:hypothetical protein
MANKSTKHAAQTQPPAPSSPSILDDGPLVPGGETSPTYKWAFNAFAVLFLLLICLGLMNYLGWYLKAWTR